MWYNVIILKIDIIGFKKHPSISQISFQIYNY